MLSLSGVHGKPDRVLARETDVAAQKLSHCRGSWRRCVHVDVDRLVEATGHAHQDVVE
jgi:hypothetical protein